MAMLAYLGTTSSGWRRDFRERPRSCRRTRVTHEMRAAARKGVAATRGGVVSYRETTTQEERTASQEGGTAVQRVRTLLKEEKLLATNISTLPHQSFGEQSPQEEISMDFREAYQGRRTSAAGKPPMAEEGPPPVRSSHLRRRIMS